MAILPIVITGEPVLHRRAQVISTVTSEIRQLAQDMVDTMHAAPGVGLAAPQVGVGVRLFVWHCENPEETSNGVVINPRLTVHGRRYNRFVGEPDDEGCLSIPGLRYPLARFDRARLRGVTLEGDPIDICATGWLARIFQHEYDHLNGTLYRDRLSRRWRRVADSDITESQFLSSHHSWHPGVDGVESDFESDFESS